MSASVQTDDRDNNLVAAGALWVLLSASISTWAVERLTAVEIVTDAQGNPTNQIDITLSFMESPYRITVERVAQSVPTAAAPSDQGLPSTKEGPHA